MIEGHHNNVPPWTAPASANRAEDWQQEGHLRSRGKQREGEQAVLRSAVGMVLPDVLPQPHIGSLWQPGWRRQAFLSGLARIKPVYFKYLQQADLHINCPRLLMSWPLIPLPIKIAGRLLIHVMISQRQVSVSAAILQQNSMTALCSGQGVRSNSFLSLHPT